MRVARLLPVDDADSVCRTPGLAAVPALMGWLSSSTLLDTDDSGLACTRLASAAPPGPGGGLLPAAAPLAAPPGAALPAGDAPAGLTPPAKGVLRGAGLTSRPAGPRAPAAVALAAAAVALGALALKGLLLAPPAGWLLLVTSSSTATELSAGSCEEVAEAAGRAVVADGDGDGDCFAFPDRTFRTLSLNCVSLPGFALSACAAVQRGRERA